MSLNTFLFYVALSAVCVAFVRWAMRSSARMQGELKEYQRRPLTLVIPSQVILPRGETAFIAVRALLREVVNMGWRSGSSGMSVRVARGVTLRTSSSRGHAVRDWATVASGELVITDQRIVFVGDNGSFSYGVDQVIGFTLEGLCKMQLTLATTGGNRRLAFIGAMDGQMAKATFEKVLAHRSGEPWPPPEIVDVTPTQPNSLPPAAPVAAGVISPERGPTVLRIRPSAAQAAWGAKMDPWVDPPQDGESR